MPRPGLRGAVHHPEWAELARAVRRPKLHRELIDPFDVIIVMHSPSLVVEIWDRLRGKRVIWRSIDSATSPRVRSQ